MAPRPTPVRRHRCTRVVRVFPDLRIFGHPAELDGPFYNPFFDTFGKSHFEPADFGLQGNTTFPADDRSNMITGGAAGQFGRDDGVVLWGSLIPNKRLKYAIGAFSGLDDDDINPDREFQYAARLSYNFWNIEDNPG